MHKSYLWTRIRIILGAIVIVLILACSGCGWWGSEKPATSDAPVASLTPEATRAIEDALVAELTELVVAPSEVVVAPGATKPLAVTAVTRSGQRLDITHLTGVSYRSSAASLVTVSRDGVLRAASSASTGSETTVEVAFRGLQATAHILVFASRADTVSPSDDAIPVVTNPTDVAVLVNKSRALPADYAPKDLVYVKVPFSSSGRQDKHKLRQEAATALEALFAKAKKENIELVAVSGYRSYQTQKNLFEQNVKELGEVQASRVVAHPGLSEHQTGLAIDVSSLSNQYVLNEDFAQTAEGKWLAAHCAEFGFIIRYPASQEAITGYAYEPWHIRYVGLPLSTHITESGLTFEQYYEHIETIPVTPAK